MHRLTTYLILIFLILVSIRSNCQIRVAVSKTSPAYEAWLKKVEPGVVIISMYGHRIDSAIAVLSTCSGLLLTGGEDVNPARYGKEKELIKCEEIDNYRDSLEFALIEKAVASEMPVFGICRGEQILNVALGGTLLTDIPTDAGIAVLHRSSSDARGCPHTINIDKKSVKITPSRGKTWEDSAKEIHKLVDCQMGTGSFKEFKSSASVKNDKELVESHLNWINTYPSCYGRGKTSKELFAKQFER
jgi:gamma-glutamyl-gamma-aminobutyrate hydrolase PuuD